MQLLKPKCGAEFQFNEITPKRSSVPTIIFKERNKASFLSLSEKKTALIKFQRADLPRWVHSTVQFVSKETTFLLQRRAEPGTDGENEGEMSFI